MIDVRIMRALKFDPKLERVRDPIILSLVAGPAGCVRRRRSWRWRCISRVRRPARRRCCYDFMLWWLRDWLGVMVTAPLIFAWVYGRPIDVDVAARRRRRRAVADAVRRRRS